MKKESEVEVFIDGQVDELGRGIGHTENGDEAWVAGALPGERVRADVLHVSKIGRVFSKSIQVIEASEHRQEVSCEHFLVCGGCDFLHASLDFQHQFKHQAVASALNRPISEVDKVVASPLTTGYRALAKFVVGDDGILGSFQPRSHDLVDMKGCVVHAPVIEKVADLIRENFSPLLELRYVIMRASIEQESVIVTLVVRKDVGQRLNSLVDELTKLAEVAQIVMSVNNSDGDALLVAGDDVILYDGPTLRENVGGLSQKLHSGAFSQINPSAAAKLYEQVIQMSDLRNQKVLDLYCGSGGISRALMAAGASQVHGVEANEQAVNAAKASSSQPGLSFESASVEDVTESFRDYDLIVVNPPRKGLSRPVTQALSELSSLKLIYVSCNPKSLARDVTIIQAGTDAEIKKIVPVDMFPHTRHVETVLMIET